MENQEISDEATLNSENTKFCALPHIPWLMCLDGKIGCRKCKEVNSLDLYNSPGIHMSQEWIKCDIFPSGEKYMAQKSLRVKTF